MQLVNVGDVTKVIVLVPEHATLHQFLGEVWVNERG
jgi:hypothetical protein